MINDLIDISCIHDAQFVMNILDDSAADYPSGLYAIRFWLTRRMLCHSEFCTKATCRIIKI